MRLLLALLALLASDVAARPQLAPAPPPLTRDAEARWVAFDYSPAGQILFQASADGASVPALLDTGVSHSVLARSAATRMKLAVAASGSAAAIGGAVPIGRATLPGLGFGGLSPASRATAVADLPGSVSGGAPVELLIGRDLLAPYALDIDYPNKRFRLLPSGRMPFTGASAPLAIDPRLDVYITSASVSGHRIAPLILDTGDDVQLTLTTPAWQSLGLGAEPPTSTIGFGLGGRIELGLAVLPQVSLGTLVSREVQVTVEPAGGYSQSLDVAGRIGSGLLRRYRVLLDPRAGHIVFTPGPEPDAPPPRYTSGLALLLKGDRLIVLHVMRNGPAAAAGVWKVGDAICSVDGTPITPDYVKRPIAQWTIDAPGRQVILGMCDGTKRALMLRNFY